MGKWEEKQRMVLEGYDLEMPQSCAECPVWSYCYEIHAKRNGMLPKDGKLEYCPIQIVEEWSKAHPIQTRADKFKEVFGDDMPFVINEMKADDCSEDDEIIGFSVAWWNAPYEAPKGMDG